MDAACDPRRCPVCGAANDCARAEGSDAPCWCFAVQIDAAALARIPDAARGRACLCRACAAVSSSAAPAAPPRDDPPCP